MFDIGASELLVIVIVAILVIGPKDMPMAMRTAGRWIGKVRRVSSHFRSGIDAMIREAELEDMEKKWKAQNEAIMAKSTANQGEISDMKGPALIAEPDVSDTESRAKQATVAPTAAPAPDEDDPAPLPSEEDTAAAAEPELPLGKSGSSS